MTWLPSTDVYCLITKKEVHKQFRVSVRWIAIIWHHNQGRTWIRGTLLVTSRQRVWDSSEQVLTAERRWTAAARRHSAVQVEKCICKILFVGVQNYLLRVILEILVVFYVHYCFNCSVCIANKQCTSLNSGPTCYKSRSTTHSRTGKKKTLEYFEWDNFD